MGLASIALRDQYRYFFKRHKAFGVSNISIWKVNSYSITEREQRAKRLEKWLSSNKTNSKEINISPGDSSFEGLTEQLLANGGDNDLFLRLYTLFNRKKFVPANLSKDLKPMNKIISLKAYCNFSKILLERYRVEKNIQYLNTSLKVNDFLLYCQIDASGNKHDGAIGSIFPNKLTKTNIEVKTNELFLENLLRELEYIKSL